MASFKEAVEWLALNDDPSETNVDAVAGSMTLALVADLWRKERSEVARKVVRMRRAEERARQPITSKRSA